MVTEPQQFRLPVPKMYETRKSLYHSGILRVFSLPSYWPLYADLLGVTMGMVWYKNICHKTDKDGYMFDIHMSQQLLFLVVVTATHPTVE